MGSRSVLPRVSRPCFHSGKSGTSAGENIHLGGSFSAPLADSLDEGVVDGSGDDDGLGGGGRTGLIFVAYRRLLMSPVVLFTIIEAGANVM